MKYKFYKFILSRIEKKISITIYFYYKPFLFTTRSNNEYWKENLLAIQPRLFIRGNILWWDWLMRHNRHTQVNLTRGLKSTIYPTSFRATVCSNRWREPIKCWVEWTGISYWFPPTVAANSCTKSCVVGFDIFEAFPYPEITWQNLPLSHQIPGLNLFFNEGKLTKIN